MATSRSDGPVRSVLSALCGSGPRAAATAVAAACGGTVAQVGARAYFEALAVYAVWAAFWGVSFLLLAAVAVAAGFPSTKGDAQ